MGRLGPSGPIEPTSDKPLLDKLGVKPGMRVAVVGVDDAAFLDELRERTGDLILGDPPPGTELVFFAADSPEQLAELPALRRRIQSDGAIWVVSRKGRGAPIRDREVIAAAVAAQLVDNKVVSFSPTHTSLRLVIRREARAEHGRATAHDARVTIDTTRGGT